MSAFLETYSHYNSSREIADQSALFQELTPSGRYDFFVLQCTTAGGFAFNELLRAHPDVYLPDREIVDQLFDSGRSGLLSMKSANPLILPTWEHHYKLGFMLHSGIHVKPEIPSLVAE
jgi:hypothetical protein